MREFKFKACGQKLITTERVFGVIGVQRYETKCGDHTNGNGDLRLCKACKIKFFLNCKMCSRIMEEVRMNHEYSKPRDNEVVAHHKKRSSEMITFYHCDYHDCLGRGIIISAPFSAIFELKTQKKL